MLTQMNIKKGYWPLEKKENEAILKELKQLHNKKALMPIRQTDIKHDKKAKL